MTNWFRVTFVSPNGYTYEATGRAADTRDAVSVADRTIEYVTRVGTSDFLNEDGTTVRPPAQLTVEEVDQRETSSGFGLVVTDPQGRVTRRCRRSADSNRIRDSVGGVLLACLPVSATVDVGGAIARSPAGGAASVDDQGCSRRVGAGPARQVDRRPGDVLEGADATQGHARLDLLPLRWVIEQERHHLRVERSRSDDVGGDVPGRELACEIARQMMDRGFGRSVGIGLTRRGDDAVDAADRDDPARIHGGRAVGE